MNDHFTDTELLIRYLDDELDPTSIGQLQTRLTDEPALAAELESLRQSRQLIRTYGLKKQVSGIHDEMMAELRTVRLPERPSVKRDGTWYGLRIAASILIILCAGVLYQYATLNSANLFKSTFSPYTTTAFRGNIQQDTLEKLYQTGQYEALIERFSQLPDPGMYDRFLAGNSFLMKQDPAKAIQEFRIIQRQNAQRQEHLLEEETDYYLAMAYLNGNQPANALPIIESIHANPRHAYHDKISGLQLAKLKWLAGKRGI